MQCIYIENHDIFPYWICTYITKFMVVIGGGGVCLREIHVIQCMYKTAKDHFIDKYLD